MIEPREQRWTPDTHQVRFTTQWDAADPEAPHVCLMAEIPDLAGGGGFVEVIGPEAHRLYELFLEENRLKNYAEALIVDALPAHMKLPQFDADGDRLLVDEGGAVWVEVNADTGAIMNTQTGETAAADRQRVEPLLAVKSKHAPRWDYGGLDGVVQFSVPGANHGLIAELQATLDARFGVGRVRMI